MMDATNAASIFFWMALQTLEKLAIKSQDELHHDSWFSIHDRWH
jgi:hypothetical protein